MGTRCAECGWSYPDAILAQMMISGKYTGRICGICALDITNRVHGVIRKRFQGQQAESNRLDAIKWRKQYPNCKPTGEKNNETKEKGNSSKTS